MQLKFEDGFHDAIRLMLRNLWGDDQKQLWLIRSIQIYKKKIEIYKFVKLLNCCSVS